MTIDVRTITADEATPWMQRMLDGFYNPMATGKGEYFLTHADLGRTRGAFEGGDVVATLRSFETELTVPGPLGVRASALTNVTVAPTHRRRGLLTEMITADLRESAERNEVVGILIASEYPIYGRFGYGPATESARYSVATPAVRFLQPSEGSVRIVDLETLRRLAPPVYERYRHSQPGAISRTDDWWDRMTRQVEFPGSKPRKGSQAVYVAPSGEIEGYVLYEGAMVADDMRQSGTLTIEELTSTTRSAYQALWEYCFGLDLLTSVESRERPVDEILPMLLDDARKVRLAATYDFVWVRPLDVVGALEGRRYESEGRLVIEVIDDVGIVDGRYELDAGPGGVTCRRTTTSPDLSVSASTLGATYLGGTSWTRLALAGRVDEHTSGSVRLANTMFVTPRVPWCSTWF